MEDSPKISFAKNYKNNLPVLSEFNFLSQFISSVKKSVVIHNFINVFFIYLIINFIKLKFLLKYFKIFSIKLNQHLFEKNVVLDHICLYSPVQSDKSCHFSKQWDHLNVHIFDRYESDF